MKRMKIIKMKQKFIFDQSSFLIKLFRDRINTNQSLDRWIESVYIYTGI